MSNNEKARLQHRRQRRLEAIFEGRVDPQAPQFVMDNKETGRKADGNAIRQFLKDWPLTC